MKKRKRDTIIIFSFDHDSFSIHLLTLGSYALRIGVVTNLPASKGSIVIGIEYAENE